MLDYLTATEWAFVALLASFILGIPMVPRVADKLAGVERDTERQ